MFINKYNNQLGIIETITYDSSTYMLIDSNTWLNAEIEAQSLGGHLVTINSQAENDFLWGYWGHNGSSNILTYENLWIGLNDYDNEGTWVWASGEVESFTNWAPGEPNDAGTGEDFAHLWRHHIPGTWNDSGILNSALGIVEIRTEVPEPSTLAIFALGMMGLASRRLKKQS
jgi:hypothetical protein